MKPHTRLIAEKVTSVTIGFAFILSAIHPTKNAILPIKSTYTTYRAVVASDLKVHRAFAKNETVTAMQKATTLENDWVEPLSSMSAKTAQ